MEAATLRSDSVDHVPNQRTKIIAIGGFPGSGKSSIAGLIAKDNQIPMLGSDLLGNTIRRVLIEQGAADDATRHAFRAGYAVLFALADELVFTGCPVIIDASLGWQFQWDALDDICSRRPEVALLPFLLDCSERTCRERLQLRHDREPDRYPPADEFLRQWQLAGVRRHLEAVERPDLRRVDAERPLDQVYRDVADQLRSAKVRSGD